MTNRARYGPGGASPACSSTLMAKVRPVPPWRYLFLNPAPTRSCRDDQPRPHGHDVYGRTLADVFVNRQNVAEVMTGEEYGWRG